MVKRSTAVLFSVLLLASLLLAQARASDYLDSYSITVSPMGNWVVKVQATVTATHPKMTEVGFPTISLYELNNGSWTVVKTVTGQYAYNAGSHSYSFQYTGTAGKSYYAAASFFAKDTTGEDVRSATSATRVAV